MLKHADPILKVALALAALFAGAGVGYYYGIYLPAQDIRRQTQEMTARQSRTRAENRALHERARREAAAQGAYQGCVASADLSYKQRWTQTCQSMNEADQAAFADCADDLFNTERGCLAKRPIRPARDCALPAAVARSLTEAREQRKGQCAIDLQAAQHGGAGPIPDEQP